MSKPTLTERSGVYYFSWPDDDLDIKVGIATLHRDGRVTGDIEITTKKKGYSRILQPSSQFNFSSARVRKEFANNLASKYPDWHWVDIFDEMSYMIQELVKRGEPVKELWTYENVSPPDYLIFPIMPLNQPTVIFGEKGVGKSEMSLILATITTLPWHDNPFGFVAPSTRHQPLILDYETDEKESLWRLKCLQEGMDLPPIAISYRRCSLPIAQDIEKIQQAIDTARTDVIIIDSLAGAAGGDLNKPEMASSFFSALRQLKVTSLIIGQTSKDINSKKKSIFGSNIFTYYSRSIWELRRTQEVGEDEMEVALFHRAANMSKLHYPYGFKITYNEHATVVKLEDVTSIPDFVKGMSDSLQIKQALRYKPMADKEIAEIIDRPVTIVRARLHNLKKKGSVTQNEDKLWGLIYKDDS